MRTGQSKRLMKRALKRIPGGVNSPVRAFGSVGGTARFIAKASGARIEDVDGNRYVDYVASWGAIIAGHAHPMVIDAVRSAAARGMSFGAPTELEIELAELVSSWVPGAERVRFVSSGTEAVMSAVRLARAATKREKLIKFDGGYHGHSNELLVKAGSGVATLGLPGTAGVTAGAVQDTLTLGFNDLEAVRACLRSQAGQVAAVLVEPIPANMGLVLPEPGFLEGLRELCDEHGALLIFDEVITGFLEGLRELCDEHGALLIFDEVITGFRIARGGATERFGVQPDLLTFAKVIGGGMPVGCYAGRAELMQLIAPEGPVFQAGTLSGNPVAMSAGLAVLELLGRPGAFDRLEKLSERLASGLSQIAKDTGVPFTARAVGGLFGFFFHPGPVRSYADAAKSDERRFRAFFHSMLDQGIYLAPSPYEAAFVTLAHGDAEVEETLAAARRAFRKAL